MMQVFQDQYNLCSIEPGMRLTVKKAQNMLSHTGKLSKICHLHLTGEGPSSSQLLLKVSLILPALLTFK